MMRAKTVLFGLIGITLIAPFAATRAYAQRVSAIPLETMSFEEMAAARAAGSGCTWLGGKGFTRRVAMKEDRGAVKRDGRIVMLRPAADASEVFPYTFHHWVGGGMDILIKNSGKEVGRGPEHVETLATLTLTEEGRSRSWRGRLNCGS
ncbi:hypothetical protein ACFX59_17100 [Sphingomonas sp. NCPPB 2930]|uniref:hypothetical protein n=1 Tax=Sphingomonas sp. NCPPB 2930 TaxID=3162788 RepID=UPI0036DBDA90